MTINYRPEIDGLRTIAVLAVIFYHLEKIFLNSNYLSGGFLGVDVFFVISGYLISFILLEEIYTTGQISFLKFYQRRIRRILPALLFVMATSIPIAYIFFLPNDLVDFSNSIISSLGFVSNFYFYLNEVSYGNENTFYKPFMHTWSLSVEEQFYFFFPLCLFIVSKYFRNNFFYSFISLFIISILIAQYFSLNHRLINFYLFPTRAWELIAGSLIAYLEIKKKVEINNLYLKKIMPTIGIILIIFSLFYFNDELDHPSFITLFPIVGTCLIICFSRNNDIIKKILSTKFFVSIGIISYSLYLWHYPIFSFAKYTNIFSDNFFQYIILILIIFSLSIFSFYLIEKPFRNKENSIKNIIYIILLLYLIIIAFSIFANLKNGKLKKYPTLIENTYKNLNYREFVQDDVRCHDRLGDKGFCRFNFSRDENIEIILLGDSLTDSLLGSLVAKTKNKNISITHMSYSGQLYIPEILIAEKKNNKIISDRKKHNSRTKILDKSSLNSYVVILGNYLYYLEKDIILDNKNNLTVKKLDFKFVPQYGLHYSYQQRKSEWKKLFKKSLIELSKNKKIILIYPLPKPPVNVMREIKSNYISNLYEDENYFSKDTINYDKEIYLNLNNEIFELFDSINEQNILKIKTQHIFCPNKKCMFYDSKNIYFFDNVHLSYKGSEIINDLILKKIYETERQK